MLLLYFCCKNIKGCFNQAWLPQLLFNSPHKVAAKKVACVATWFRLGSQSQETACSFPCSLGPRLSSSFSMLFPTASDEKLDESLGPRQVIHSIHTSSYRNNKWSLINRRSTHHIFAGIPSGLCYVGIYTC